MLSVHFAPVGDVCNDHDPIALDPVNHSVITDSESVKPLKLPFEGLDVGMTVGISTENFETAVELPLERCVSVFVELTRRFRQ